jgi:enamine deaminase RidA (YjgF/YER057c/UK114 family)
MSKQIIAPYRKSDSLVFLSGVTGEPGDSETQVVNAFEKVRQRLKEAGTSMENIISVVVYLVNLNDRETALNPIWEKYFPTNPPARTTVEVGLGKGRLVEIQVVANMPPR